MSGVSVTGAREAPFRTAAAARHQRRLAVRRVIVSVLIVGLSIWLAGAAQAPGTGLVQRVLLLVIAALLPLHLFFWQLGGIKLVDAAKRVAKPLAILLVFLALGTSPLVLYPLGLVAVLVALATGGGAATPALAVSGLLMLSPIILILAIALMFMASGYKGG